LINLWLSHCSHSDYFNNVFTNFSGLANFNPLETYGGVRQLSDLIKKTVFRRWTHVSQGWNNMRVKKCWHIFHFSVNHPF